MWLLSGSMPLFTAFGIRVRPHASMVILIALTLIMSGPWRAWRVERNDRIHHPFRHHSAARIWTLLRRTIRWRGGERHSDVALGGLAYADAPRRAWPQLWTAIGGPLVNVAICVLTGIGLAGVNWSAGHVGIPWNPLSRHFFVPYDSTAGYYFWWIFIISWSNLLFNVLPIFPLDGGHFFKLRYGIGSDSTSPRLLPAPSEW